MTKTKDQQAQEYAKQIQKDFIHNRLVTEELAFEDIEAAWLAGYTACEQSMWLSVEDELPEPDTMCLVFGYQDLDFNGRLTRYTMMAWYDGEDFMDAYNDRKYHPEKWMAIPLPDTNTEKK